MGEKYWYHHKTLNAVSICILFDIRSVHPFLADVPFLQPMLAKSKFTIACVTRMPCQVEELASLFVSAMNKVVWRDQHA